MGRDWWSPDHLCKKSSIYHSNPITTYCKTSKKKKIKAVFWLIFLWKTIFHLGSIGYISITSEKNNLKTHVPLQKTTFKENPSTLPQLEQCSSLIINTARRLQPLPAFQKENIMVSVVLQQITFYFSFRPASLPHASLPFVRNNRECSFHNLQLTWTKFLQEAHMIKIY